MPDLKHIPEKQNSKDSAAAFWKWFIENEQRFRSVEKTNSEEALAFLDDLITEMKPFNPWLKALAGPYSTDKHELIITADGDIALFCKVEELIQAAPKIEGWIITAHKPPLGFEGISIDMYDKEFSSRSMHFYPINNSNLSMMLCEAQCCTSLEQLRSQLHIKSLLLTYKECQV